MILYEDNHLLLLNKPAGISTQPDLEIQAKTLISTRFLHAVHRLDKPTSGIALFAKTQKALSRLNTSLRNRHFQKTYFAIVEGTPPSSQTLTHYLYHGDHRAEIFATPQKNAKEALLTYKTLQSYPNCTLLQIDLLTGRYHQIRAQLAHIGYPIYYDSKYGSKKTSAYPGILLHHGKLSFPHPTTHETLTIECPLPPEFTLY